MLLLSGSGVSCGVVVCSLLDNDYPSSSSKEHEHRSSCEDSGTLSVLTCYVTCVMGRYLSPAHALAAFKWHRSGPLHVKLVNKAQHVGMWGWWEIWQCSDPYSNRVPLDSQSNALPLRHTRISRSGQGTVLCTQHELLSQCQSYIPFHMYNVAWQKLRL